MKKTILVKKISMKHADALRKAGYIVMVIGEPKELKPSRNNDLFDLVKKELYTQRIVDKWSKRTPKVIK